MTIFQGTATLTGNGRLYGKAIPLSTINSLLRITASPELFFVTDAAGPPYSYVVGGDTFVSEELITDTGGPTTFIATARYPKGRYPIEYHWDFGDRTEGWGEVVEHTYEFYRPHLRVTLRVTDNFGKRIFARKQIYLQD